MQEALRQKKSGTKFAPAYKLRIQGGRSETVHLRLSSKAIDNPFAPGFEDIFTLRKQEADEFYAKVLEKTTTPDWQKFNAGRWPVYYGANSITISI